MKSAYSPKKKKEGKEVLRELTRSIRQYAKDVDHN